MDEGPEPGAVVPDALTRPGAEIDTVHLRPPLYPQGPHTPPAFLAYLDHIRGLAG